LKKKRNALIITLAAFSLLLQGIFVFYFFRISDWNKFLYIKDRIKNIQESSISLASEYENFRQDENTVIFLMPSVSSSNIMMFDSFDYSIVLFKDNMLLFSVYPSKQSYRKHLSMYVENIKKFRFALAGDFLSFRVKTGSSVYYCSLFTNKGYCALPSSAGVF